MHADRWRGVLMCLVCVMRIVDLMVIDGWDWILKESHGSVTWRVVMESWNWIWENDADRLFLGGENENENEKWKKQWKGIGGFRFWILIFIFLFFFWRNSFFSFVKWIVWKLMFTRSVKLKKITKRLKYSSAVNSRRLCIPRQLSVVGSIGN